MLASEKLYIVSRRSVLEHRINECLIYFSCWIKGNINAQYLPPFTPSPPSCAQQIQRRLMMHGACAYVDDWTCHWNRSIPFALCEIHMDRAPGPRSCVDTSSECAKLLWYPSWGGYCSVGFQQGKKGPFYLFSVPLWSENAGLYVTTAAARGKSITHLALLVAPEHDCVTVIPAAGKP